MRLIVSRMTPGETFRCLGMSAVWVPQEHTHVVCGPVSLLTEQLFLRSARITSRSFIALATL